MKQIRVDIDNVKAFLGNDAVNNLENAGADALDKVMNATAEGNDFLGWVELPTETTDAHLDDIIATAEQLRADCDTVVAIGIGGSYLGAKAVIEALSWSWITERLSTSTMPPTITESPATFW